MNDDSREAATQNIGRDRDPLRLALMLANGASVIVAGSLGSGKTHLMRAVLDVLAQGPNPPLILRANASLAEKPFGVLEASNHPRAIEIRDAVADSSQPSLIVVVDDADLLDEATADALVSAIYAGRARGVFGIHVPRARAAHAQNVSAATTMINELWMSNAAERIDLDELQPDDAEQLMNAFPGTDELDAVARATVIALADGSRMLLRELSAVAVNASRSGKDPIRATRDIRPHSRAGETVAAHVRELGESDRLALAFLHLVPHVEYANATRFLPVATIDELLAAGLVWHDSSAHKRLIANWCLAREAARQGETAANVEALTCAAEKKMLSPAAEWWSPPIAHMIAERWHGGRGAGEPPEVLPADARARVALTAARVANDVGQPALAIAYAALADDQETPALELERLYAGAVLGQAEMACRALADIDPLALDDDLLLRYLRMRAHVVARQDLTILNITKDNADVSSPGKAQLVVSVAEAAALQMDWARARELGDFVRAVPDIDPSTAVRAQFIAAMSNAHLGSWSTARALFDGIAHMTTPESAPVVARSTDRVLSLCAELLASAAAGAEAPGFVPRLRAEVESAARGAHMPVVMLVGMCTALAYANAGQVAHAARELNVAYRRTGADPLGPYFSLIELSVARALVMLGQRDAGAAIIGRERGRHVSAMQEHARLTAKMSESTAAGQFDRAACYARSAAAMTLEAPALHLRDLYHLAALGDRDATLLRKMQDLAGRLDMPSAMGMVTRAAGIFGAKGGGSRVTATELVQFATPWSENAEHCAWVEETHAAMTFSRTSTMDRVAPHTLDPVIALTQREREVAQLVAEGFSNREIAARLFLSIRTVESHVYQARPKIGAHSRRDFQRLMPIARRDLAP